MSPTLLTLAIALFTPAMPPGQGPSAALPQPLSDGGLKIGTVSILVRGIQLPSEQVEALLVPAKTQVSKPAQARAAALATGKTNDKGRIFLHVPQHVGENVKAVVIRSNAVRHSVDFAVPQAGGARLLFVFGASGGPHGGPQGGPHGGPHGRPTNKPGKTTHDPAHLKLWLSFRFMGMERDKLYVALIYTIVNRGAEAYSPGSHGLFLPVPPGATGVSLPSGTRGVKVDKHGVFVSRVVPAGGNDLRVTVTFQFPVDSPRRVVSIQSALPALGYTVSIAKYKGVSITSPDLGKPRKVGAHRPGAPETLLYHADAAAFPKRTLRFTLNGLPVRDRSQSMVFMLLGGLLVLLGFGFALARVVQRRPSKKADGPAADDPVEAKVNALVKLERRRILGLVTDDEATEQHARILGKPADKKA